MAGGRIYAYTSGVNKSRIVNAKKKRTKMSVKALTSKSKNIGEKLQVLKTMLDKRIDNKIDKAIETKYLDIDKSGAIGAQEENVLINGLSEGDTASTRSGRQIRNIGVYMTFHAYVAAATNGYADYSLVWTKEVDGAITYFSDVYNGTVYQKLIDQNNQHNYTVLWSKRFYLEGGGDGVAGTAGQGRKIINFSKYIDLKKRITIYNGANEGDITDIESGSLYLIGLYSGHTDTTRVFKIRFTYKDA